MQFVVLSGQSGAGKTTARFVLEDLGYFSVDNLPPVLWVPLVQTLEAGGVSKAAVVLDIRARAFLDSLPQALQALSPLIVFLEARAEVLLRRYNLSRRVHPLGTGDLLREIERELAVLAPLRERADLVIDTSEKTPRELQAILEEALGEKRGFLLRLVSFGFKWGPPQDADLILDVRGLPNPYYEPHLAPKPGTDPEVSAYIFRHPQDEGLYRTLLTTAGLSAQKAQDSGRAAYTVGIGCTGGRHRSVAVVERLAQELSSRFRIETEHRDLTKEGGAVTASEE
jgi:UPF0042 nucleotide-binding protein